MPHLFKQKLIMKLIILLLGLLFITCNSDTEQISQEQIQTSSDVTLIFDISALSNIGDTIIIKPIFDTVHLSVQYTDQNFRYVNGRVADKDILNIPIERNFFEFGLSTFYDAKPQYNYRIKRGDSILISTLSGYPYITILNREFDSTSLNASYYLNINEQPFLLDGVDLALTRNSNDKQTRLAEYYLDLKIKSEVLDSLVNHGMINDNDFRFQQKILSGQKLKIELWNRHNRINFESSEFDLFKLLSEQIELNDSSALFNPLFQSILNQYSVGELIKYNKNSLKESRFDLAFDSLLNHNGIPQLQKEYILAQCIYRLSQNESTPVVNRYIKKFLAFSSNKKLNEYVVTNYFIDLNFLKDRKDSLMLINTNKHTTNFLDIVKDIETDYAYIDIWASWCKPCLAAMPSSKLRRIEYKDKITFIYLSIDKEMDAWKKANKKVDLEFYKHNYLLLNPDSALIFRDLNIQTIPRYLLINKLGQIIDSNSPAPIDELQLQIFINSLP